MIEVNEGILIGYSSSSKAYKVYNKRNNLVEESLNVVFEKNLSSTSTNTTDEGVLFELKKLSLEDGNYQRVAKEELRMKR